MSYKAGYVALVGEPNAGKSTLLNSILGQKLSIVSPKPQTTRHKIAGILTGEDYQAVFLDTPGLINPSYALQEIMMNSAREAVGDADIVVLISDASRKETVERSAVAIAQLESVLDKKTVFVVINKIDLIKKGGILPLIDAFQSAYHFDEIIPVSALSGENVADLKDTILKYLPEGNAFYPEDYMSDRDERFFTAELIREELFKFFKQEIPYSTTVGVEEFRESDNERKTFIRAIIYVEKDSQKGIIIGKGGTALKRVGQNSRRAIEEMIGHEVFLELFVKVEKDWRDDKGKIRKLGYK